MKSFKNILFFFVSLSVTFHLICYSLVHNRLGLYHFFTTSNESFKSNFTIRKSDAIDVSISESYKIYTTKSKLIAQTIHLEILLKNLSTEKNSN